MELQHHFGQLLRAISEDDLIQYKTDALPTLTPYLFPEIWSRIFVMAFGNMKQLSRMTRICKSVYYYCWHSPAAKANFYFERYGRRKALFMAFAQFHQFKKLPKFDKVLEVMVQNGARYSCLDTNQKCPLLSLSGEQDAVRLINMFYSSNPHISEDHLRMVLKHAIKKGSLDLLLAFLQQDPNTANPFDTILALRAYQIEVNVGTLISDGQFDLAMYFAAAGNLEFSQHTVGLAINSNLNTLAQRLIESRLIAPETKLSEEVSDVVWGDVRFNDVEKVNTALALGVAPTPYCLKRVSGCLSSNLRAYEINNGLRISFHRPYTIDETWASAYSLPLIDLFMNLGIVLDEIVLSNAAVSGEILLVVHLLEKWKGSDSYAQRCLVTPLAIHNAHMRREWAIVELFISYFKEWHMLHTANFNPSVTQLFDPNPYYISNHLEPFSLHDTSCFPLSANDDYYFQKTVQLVEHGLYATSVYSNGLGHYAVRSHDVPLEESVACFKRLFSIGAILTAHALANAAFDGEKEFQLTPRFKYLLEKFVENPRNITDPDEQDDFMDQLADRCSNDTDPEILPLILSKGIPITGISLFSAFRASYWNSELPPVVEALVHSTKPGKAATRFFEIIMEWEQTDWEDYRCDQAKRIFEIMQENGIKCPQNVLEWTQVETPTMYERLFSLLT